MASTPIYNWPTPDNTGLVKNGALDMRTLGNAIDTTMGTMVPKTIVDAKGDLIAATAADTTARLAVGANGETLVADSSTATGLDWKSAAEQYPWQTWTPTYTRLTIGNGTVVARYQQIGKTINFFWKLTWGTTTSVTNYPVFSLPVAAFNSGNEFTVGNATLQDLSGSIYWGRVDIATDVAVIHSEYTGGTWNTLGVVDNGSPATWANTDIWTATGSYEVA